MIRSITHFPYLTPGLGVPVFAEEGGCPACGSVNNDIYGDHSIGCASQGERIARHNQLRDALFHAAASAALAPLREERALLPGVGGDQRPADVLLPHGAGGLHQALDISVVSSLQTQLVDKAADQPGSALQNRFTQKWNKYGDACKAEGIVFTPMPVEVLGGWGESGIQVVKRLGTALARHSGQE